MKRKKPQKLPNVTSGMSDTDEDNNDNSAEQRQNAINQKYLQVAGQNETHDNTAMKLF